MRVSKSSYYEACDEAVKVLNRQNLEAFGRLKMLKMDRLNVISEVMSLYRESAKKARKRYYDIAYDAYMLGLMMCDVEEKKARTMAGRRINEAWVDTQLTETDFITLYRFDTEMERKAYRLAEVLEVSPDRNREIDKALKDWTRQIGQFGIKFTDNAILQAFIDAGVETVEWVSENDGRVCSRCIGYNGMRFPAREIPSKPHYGCRCMLFPVK